MAFAGVDISAGLSVAGRAAVYLGASNTGYTDVNNSMFNVGALDGTVSISPNQDIVKLQRSDGQNPYAVLETAYDFQVSFSIQETDVFNLGMSLSYNTATGVSASSSEEQGLGNQGVAGTAYPIGGAAGDNDGNTRALTLGSDNQAPYRSMIIRVEGGLTGANADGARVVAEWQFYKVKIQATGSVDYDRTGAVTYPVTAHCLGNSSDVVGRFVTPNTFDRANDYGDS